jgi:hypothetical protein
VKQEIFTFRNLQNTLTEDLTKLEQTYNSVQQQQNSIVSMNNRIPKTVNMLNKIEESKLEIKDVDSNSSTNAQIITIQSFHYNIQ